jgi:tetratricopeptide (TPR) repeat protein
MTIQFPSGERELFAAAEDRYEQLELIGSGGMGRVYKAWDRKLKRTVALKILKDIEDYQDRFVREAEAQARIDHENVCRIYDTGVLNGQTYIAMQYIDGQPLSVAYKTLSIEDKVRAIISAARGVHAAQRIGIIQRDLKPAHLMVWRSEEGTIHTSVLDFGLARDMATEGLTSSGIVLGTIQYSAPEQALGEAHRLDRRTDVYSLGITLYEILMGRLPFDGRTTVNVLVNVLNSDPSSFDREVAIPGDLETIVMKCLEKEQHRRYDSAAELADDLERFLAGEPIQARRASLLYRTGRMLRRNRKVAAMLAGALAVTGAIGGVAVHDASVREQQAVLAQRFGDEVRYVEELVRHAHTSPLHDITAEQQKAREYVNKLRAEVAAEGEIGHGPGQAALGMAYLAVGDLDGAVKALEDAWKMGYRTPQSTFALGTVRGRQYQQRLVEIERMPDPALRKIEVEKAEAQFRAPALQLLKQARGGVKVQSPEYLEALIAFYDGRYDEAQRHVSDSLDRYPWMYEARVLRASIELIRGNDRRERGDYEGANRHYARADQAYVEALKTAQSDPGVYEDLCNVWRDRLQFEVQSRGGDVRPHIARAEAACSSAILADPNSAFAYATLAGAYGRFAQWEYKRDLDFRGTTEKGCAAADRAAELDPRSDWVQFTRGFAYFWRATSPKYSHEERLKFVDQSLASARKAAELNPNMTLAYNQIGNAALARHNVMVISGADPRAVLRDAIVAYQRAIVLESRSMSPYNNIGHAWTHMGDYERLIGVDPTPSLRNAVASGRKAFEVNPGVGSPPFVVANAERKLAELAVDHRRDPSANVKEAILWSGKAMKIAPREHAAFYMAALAHLQMARYHRMRGVPTAADESLMMYNLDQALERSAESQIAFATRARIRLWQALDPSRAPEERRAMLDEALALAAAAREKHPESAELFALFGECAKVRAQLSAGSDRSRFERRAKELNALAAGINPLMTRRVEEDARLYTAEAQPQSTTTRHAGG